MKQNVPCDIKNVQKLLRQLTRFLTKQRESRARGFSQVVSDDEGGVDESSDDWQSDISEMEFFDTEELEEEVVRLKLL